MEALIGLYGKVMRQSAEQACRAGIQSGNGGNLSVRIPGTETMLIKASGGSFSNLRDDDIVLAGFDGRVLAGSAKPSREILTHALLYRSRPATGAIFHSHSPWAIACAARYESVPVVTLHMEMKLGPIPILVSDGHADGQMIEDLSGFLAAHPETRAFIHRRHGIFSLAATIFDAEMQAELVEECAQIAILELMTGAKN